MLKVAITGNIASGKSVVEGILRDKGFKVLDTDEVAHSLLFDEKVKNELISSFTEYDILENDGISRPKLARIVFDDEVLRKKLENIIHPRIKDEIEKFFYKNENEKITFVSVPLLFEAKFEKIFNKIILIYADDKIRLERLMNRSNLSLEHAQNRIEIQMNQDEKISLADYVIYNNKSLNDLSINLNEILKSL